MASSRNLVSTIGALASPKIGDGTRCPEAKQVICQPLLFLWKKAAATDLVQSQSFFRT